MLSSWERPQHQGQVVQTALPRGPREKDICRRREDVAP